MEAPRSAPQPSPEEACPLAGRLPKQDFWEALYRRRSIRRFKPDPVPRELIDQVVHAGTWAPSSCNYQMWDLVVVDDPDLNARLAELSLQLGNAPVNIVVTYGRGFSEENLAGIQSASAMIQNMSLAAQVLGLGTFWITQTGDPRRLAEMVGLPEDRRVVAVLALGYPKAVPPRGPKRRPLDQVRHFNHYGGRPIPSSADPEDWDEDLLTLYQRARVLNGLRHNKPRAWEVRALSEALDRLLPEAEGRWLDVLPCTGILTERLARLRPGCRFDIVERSPEVAEWVAARTRPEAGKTGWPTTEQLPAPAEETYDVVSCFYRLEGLRAEDRAALMRAMGRWVKPGGALLLGFVNARSFHGLSERLRARRGGLGGVEYVLAPDPNIGPFQALSPDVIAHLAREAGLELEAELGLQALPEPDEIEFRTRNFSPTKARLARLGRSALGLAAHLPGARARRGRFQYRLYRRPL